MALVDQVRQQLGQLVPSVSPLRLQVAAPPQRAAIGLASLDRVGCEVDELLVHDDTLAGAGIGRVQQVSQDLAGRLNYLLEPISPIEIDADRCVVQMRSQPPQAAPNQTTYYELLVERSGDLRLVRYEAVPGAPRRPIAMQLTREVLLRLIDDFSQAAA